MILSVILAFIPVIGWLISFIVIILYGVLALGSFGLWVFLMYKAFSGQKYMLPMIGPMAEKYAG